MPLVLSLGSDGGQLLFAAVVGGYFLGLAVDLVWSTFLG